MAATSPAEEGNRGLVRRRLRLTRNPEIPCVLIECGYISNPSEARLIADAGYRQALAKSIAVAIRDKLMAVAKASGPAADKGQKGAKQVVAKADTSATKGKDKAAIKTHVVKPNETLFRVAVMYDLSVDELKKLNKMSAKDNTIKAGQRIKVSG